MKNIVICGNYGAQNIGDEAILDGILMMVRRGLVTAVESESSGCNITVMSADFEGTELRLSENFVTTTNGIAENKVQTERAGETSLYKTPRVVPLFPAGIRSLFYGLISGSIWKTARAVREADTFILGGGGLFQDERPMAVIIWALQAWLARFYKVPIFCLGQSVGPLTTLFGRHVTKWVFQRASIITVRDQSSADLLYGMGITGAKVLADPAFSLPSPEPFNERPEKFVVLSLRPWKDNRRKKIGSGNYTVLAKFIEWIKLEYGLKTVLVPFHPEDLAALKMVLGADSQYEYTSNYHKILELMSRATAVIGMRLHSIIFSTLAKTPFIALSYSEKVHAFARTIDMEDFVLDWSLLTLKDLQDRFKILMDHRNELSIKAGDGGFISRKKTLEHEEILRH